MENNDLFFNRFLYLVMLCLLVSLLTGCNSVGQFDPNEKMPGLDAPLGSMNQKVEIMFYPTSNPLKIDDSVGFLVKNVSTKKIKFNQVNAYKIFVKDGNVWKLIIDNEAQNDGDIFLNPQGAITEIIVPELGTYHTKVLVRLVVTAQELNGVNEPGNLIYAFGDFYMEP